MVSKAAVNRVVAAKVASRTNRIAITSNKVAARDSPTKAASSNKVAAGDKVASRTSSSRIVIISDKVAARDNPTKAAKSRTAN